MDYRELKPEVFRGIPSIGGISARVLEYVNRTDLKAYVFSDRPGTYTCLLPVEDTLQELPAITGLDIRYAQFRMDGREMEWHVQVECRTEAYLANFTEIIREIMSEMDRDREVSVVPCVCLVIAKWRHFLSEPAIGIMSEEETVGLLAELMLLKRLIVGYGSSAEGFWIANRGEEDFVREDVAIEVKGSLKEKHEHVINGIDQLNVPNGSTRYVLSLLLVRSGDLAALNLPSLVEECKDGLSDSPAAVDSLFRKLRARGYDPRDSEGYLVYGYSFVKGGYFKVDDSFPKLTTRDLRNPLNSRISKVSYRVDMEGLPSMDFESTEPVKIL
jgi:hypothetical protein